MNFALAFVILSLAVIHCSCNSEEQDKPPRCIRACTREYNPICGTLISRDGRVIRCTFANQCLLNLRRCLTRERWAAIRGRCPKDSVECRRLTSHD